MCSNPHCQIGLSWFREKLSPANGEQRRWRWADFAKNYLPQNGPSELPQFRKKYRALGRQKNGVQHATEIYPIPRYTRPWYIRSTLYYQNTIPLQEMAQCHDDVIKWKHFPRYWPFVRGIHWSPLNSRHKVQWRRALMFTLICPPNKRLSKQSWGWWFEMPSCSLWRHFNGHADQWMDHYWHPKSTVILFTESRVQSPYVSHLGGWWAQATSNAMYFILIITEIIIIAALHDEGRTGKRHSYLYTETHFYTHWKSKT